LVRAGAVPASGSNERCADHGVNIDIKTVRLGTPADWDDD
jgi:hypothetical protein